MRSVIRRRLTGWLAGWLLLQAAGAMAQDASDVWDQVEHNYGDANGVKIDGYRAAAVDLRGYNLSDNPKGVENYAMPLLAGDIAAVVKAEKVERAIIVGYDWGGSVAWNVAMRRPDITQLPSATCPSAGIAREIATNPQQKKNSEYAFNFQKPDAPPPRADFTFPNVKALVLMFHGVEDQALLPGALDGTWHWPSRT